MTPDKIKALAEEISNTNGYDWDDEIVRLAIDYLAILKGREKSKAPMNFKIENYQVKAIRRMQETIHKGCVSIGWYDDLETGEPIKRNFGVAISLMHSELSETFEGWRRNLMDDHLPKRKMVEVELADTIMRILDTAEAEGLDVAGAIQEKFAYNQQRADHKIENRRKDNGKKI